MKYGVQRTTQFRKQYSLMQRRGLNMSKLDNVITLLAMGQALPPKNHDHALTGNRVGQRECHIGPDWLLVYRIHNDVLILELLQTGSHSDLF